MLEFVLVVCLRHCNNVLACNMALKVTFSISKTKTKLKPFVLKTKPIVLKTKPIVSPNILLFWQFERASECGSWVLF